MHTRTWLLLGAGAMLVANAGAEAQQRMQGSGIRIVKDEVVPSVSTTGNDNINVVGGDVTTSLVPFDLSIYANNMNEKNITAHMAAGDSLEIQLAQLAQSKATDSRVRDYAATLASDHTAHLAKTWEIITDEDVGFEPMANDPEGARTRATLANLRGMAAGASWDAAFLRFQAEHHQHEIDILNSNIKNAHDDDLEEHIEDSVKSLTKHRDMARSIATTLGISTP